MKIYGWYFKSHDDPQTHRHDKVSELVRTLFAKGTQRARREYAQGGVVEIRLSLATSTL